MFKVTNLHFLHYRGDNNELKYVNDMLTSAEVVVGSPNLETKSESNGWEDQIVSMSIRLEFPDVGITHDNVFQWERYRVEDRYSGDLVIGDQRVTEEDLDPIAAIQAAIEYALAEELSGTFIGQKFLGYLWSSSKMLLQKIGNCWAKSSHRDFNISD